MVYIYYLEDPRESKRGYVGKTSKNPKIRLSEHLTEARLSNGLSNKQEWLLELIELGLSPILNILEKVEVNWQERERYWISYLREEECYTLFNVLSGGEGRNWDEITEEARRRRSEITRDRYRDPEARKKQSLTMKARIQQEPGLAEKYRRATIKRWENLELRSEMGDTMRKHYTEHPELRQKQSELSKARWQDPVYREKTTKRINEVKAVAAKKHSESMKKKWQDPEYREKTIRTAAEGMNTKESFEKRSKLSKDRWQDPQAREKLLNGLRSPESRQKVSKKAKTRFENPDERKKVSQRMKTLYQDPERLQKMRDREQSSEARKRGSERMKAIWAERKRKAQEQE